MGNFGDTAFGSREFNSLAPAKRVEEVEGNTWACVQHSAMSGWQYRRIHSVRIRKTVVFFCLSLYKPVCLFFIYLFGCSAAIYLPILLIDCGAISLKNENQGESKYSKTILPHCLSVHHISYMILIRADVVGIRWQTVRPYTRACCTRLLQDFLLLGVYEAVDIPVRQKGIMHK